MLLRLANERLCCRYSAEENAHILWGANVKSKDAAAQVIQRLNDRKLSTRDASSIEAVQVKLDWPRTGMYQAP